MSKGANYVVSVTRFYNLYGELTHYTRYYYFNGKEAAVKRAREYAKGYNCGAFEDTMDDGSFARRAESKPQANGDVYWIGVCEINTED